MDTRNKYSYVPSAWGKPRCVVGQPHSRFVWAESGTAFTNHALLSDASLSLSNAWLSAQGSWGRVSRNYSIFPLPQDKCRHDVAQTLGGQDCCSSSPGNPGAASPWRWHFQVFGVSSASLPGPPTSCSKSVFCFHSQWYFPEVVPNVGSIRDG